MLKHGPMKHFFPDLYRGTPMLRTSVAGKSRPAWCPDANLAMAA
jgi:hypothetical protein